MTMYLLIPGSGSKVQKRTKINVRRTLNEMGGTGDPHAGTKPNAANFSGKAALPPVNGA
jgi:hypothetical protein